MTETSESEDSWGTEEQETVNNSVSSYGKETETESL